MVGRCLDSGMVVDMGMGVGGVALVVRFRIWIRLGWNLGETGGALGIALGSAVWIDYVGVGISLAQR